MTTNIIVPEKGSMKSKVLYLMDNYPELSRIEMGKILGKSVGSIYSQVYLIKKERAEGKLPPPAPAPIKQAVEMPVQVGEPPVPPEPYQYSLIEEDHAILDALLLQEPPPLEPPPIPFETVASTPTAEPMATVAPTATDFSKIPKTLDLSLTGISGGHLKTLLTQLLNNSLSDSAEYSFVLSVERKKSK